MRHKAMMVGFFTLALAYFASGIACQWQTDKVADRVKALEDEHIRIRLEQKELRKYVADRMKATDRTIVEYWKRYKKEAVK